MNPIQFPQQGLYGESCPFTGPSLHTSQIPYKKISLNKEIFPFCPRSQSPSCSPKAGPPWKQTANVMDSDNEYVNSHV